MRILSLKKLIPILSSNFTVRLLASVESVKRPGWFDQGAFVGSVSEIAGLFVTLAMSRWSTQYQPPMEHYSLTRRVTRFCLMDGLYDRSEDWVDVVWMSGSLSLMVLEASSVEPELWRVTVVRNGGVS
jgi:hypothetical protein